MAMKPLNDLRALFKEPQLMHRWTIEVPTWPSAVQPANPDILFLVTSSSLPEPEYENAMVELGGYKFNYNGKSSRNGTLEWTFVENTASEVLDYFHIQYGNKLQKFDDINSVSLESVETSELLAPVVNMNLYAADGRTLTKQIQLMNVLFNPKGFGGELGQSGSEVMKPGVSVLFDSFVWQKR